MLTKNQNQSAIYSRAMVFASLLCSTVLSAATFSPPTFAEEIKESENKQSTAFTLNDIEFFADSLSYENDIVTATGNIKLMREGYTLYAGRIIYDINKDTVVAEKAVQITDSDGNTIWSERIELPSDLSYAFVSNIRLIMKDGAQLAAKQAKRLEETGNITLDKAVYSACKVCEGSSTNPKWQLKAVRVIHDKAKKRLYYKDAYLEIFGFPIFWLPKFSHPDPTVERANGLLPVEISGSQHLGLVVGLPYYHSFSESSDMTITPIITTKERVVLAGEYRQHLGYGQFEAAGSVTYVDERDGLNNLTGDKVFRGHVFAKGTINHSKNWRSTAVVNWASDDTYLQRYNFSDVDSLTSEYKLEGFYGQSYISARTITFQGLRREDTPELIGQALPMIEADYVWDNSPIGGLVTLTGNALMLEREYGQSKKRLFARARWQKRGVFTNGLVWSVDALMQTDYQKITNNGFGNAVDSRYDYNRSNSSLSLNLSYPWVKYSQSATHIIEPVVEITLSPEYTTEDLITNEDARAFDLNSYTLFGSDRLSGYDLWERGSRLTYGMNYRYSSQKWSLETMIGQSYATDNDLGLIANTSGLESDGFSHIVGRVKLTIDEALSVMSDFRFDSENFNLKRHDFTASYSGKQVGLDIRYFKADAESLLLFSPVSEEITINGRIQLKNLWWVSGYVTEDLTSGREGVNYGFGLDYRDDCIAVGVHFRKTFTRDRDIEPGNSIMLSIKLKNLG